MAKRRKLNRIKEVLIEKERTQGWLAERLRIREATVNRYANNAYQPPLETLFEIARFLHCRVSDLINE